MSAQFACYAEDVAVGCALRLELEGEKGPVEVAVVRDEEGDLHAVSDICSHGAVSQWTHIIGWTIMPGSSSSPT